MSKRPLAVISAVLLLTLIIAQYIEYHVCAMLGVFALIASSVLMFIKSLRRHLSAAAVMLTVSLAFFIYALRFCLYIQPVKALDGVSGDIVATVSDEPSYYNGRYRYKVRVKELSASDISNFNLIISSRSDLGLNVCDRVEGGVTFFDSEQKSESVFIYAYVDLSKDGLSATVGKRTPYYYAVAARQAVRELVSDMIDGDDGALITAMLTGDRGGFSDSALSSIRSSGISHITVVSGLHLSVLVNALILAFTAAFRSRRIASAVCIPFVVAIMALAGFAPSVMRAGITFIIYLGGAALLKRSDGATLLGASVLIQCLANPTVVLSASFLMSVFSTLGIHCFYNRARNYLINSLHLRSRIMVYAADSIALSLSAQLMSLPVVIMTVGLVTPAAVVTNLLVGLPVSLLVCLSAIGSVLCLSGVFSFLGRFFMMSAGFCAKFILTVADLVAHNDITRFHVSSFAAIMTCSAACFAAALCLLMPFRHKVRVTALVTALTVGIGVLIPIGANMNTVSVTAIDVYDGAAVLVSDGSYHALIGCGGDSYSAKSVIYALGRLDIDRLDVLIVPSGSDSLESGAPLILRSVGADTVIASDDRLDTMKLDGTERCRYADCTARLTERISADINGKNVIVTVGTTRVAVCGESANNTDADVIILPDKFDTTTCGAKCVIISGETANPAFAADLARDGKQVCLLGTGRSITVRIRENTFKLNREISF